MEVLYLTYDGLTDPLGQSQILPYLVWLSREGFRFTIISFEKGKNYQANQSLIQKICEENKINWLHLPYRNSPPVLSTIFGLWKMSRLAKKIMKSGRMKIIHCRSYPVSLIGLFVKKKYETKFVFDMRGFWADERVEGGLWDLNNPVYKVIYKFFKEQEKKFLTNADHIISLTNNAKAEIESWKIESRAITVIPTCVDLELFDPAKIEQRSKSEVKEKMGLKETDFILLYLGSWGTWYLTDQMLNYFSDLKKEKPDAKFLIVTYDHVDLRNYLHAKDIIVTSVSRSQVPLYISVCHAALCFIKPSFSKKASSATKIAEILAMNVPVITNSGWGDIDSLSRKTPGLILYHQSGSGPRIEKNINSRDYCIENFDIEKGVERYSSIYRQLLQSPH